MIDAGLSFADALKEAQEKGFAEQDPTADVEGLMLVEKFVFWHPLLSGFMYYLNRYKQLELVM